MPFSFSNISGTAIIVMIVCLSVAELVKYLKKHAHHLEK